MTTARPGGPGIGRGTVLDGPAGELAVAGSAG